MNHIEGFCRSNNGGVRINLQEVCNICCMIRFHMLYDEIIRFAAIQYLLDIVKPLMGKFSIYRIHNSNFFIQNGIGIIGDSVWHFVLTLKKVNAVIVYADVLNGICDFHSSFLHFIWCVDLLFLNFVKIITESKK